jgi:hypothetical protein
MPNIAFRMRGNTTDDEFGPVPPAMISLVLASAMVFTAAACQLCCTSKLELTRPIQLKAPAS